MNGFLASPAQEFLLRQMKCYQVLSRKQIYDLLQRFGTSERAWAPILNQLIQFGQIECKGDRYTLPGIMPSSIYQMAAELILRLFRSELPEVYPLLAPKVLAAVANDRMLVTVWIAKGQEHEIRVLTPPHEMPTVTALLLEDRLQAERMYVPYPCLVVWRENDQLKIQKKEPEHHG